MLTIVIFRAHLPEHTAHAKRFIKNGRKIIIHTNEVTPEVVELSKNPLVQSRFGSANNLTHMADFVVE